MIFSSLSLLDIFFYQIQLRSIQNHHVNENIKSLRF